MSCFEGVAGALGVVPQAREGTLSRVPDCNPGKLILRVKPRYRFIGAFQMPGEACTSKGECSRCRGKRCHLSRFAARVLGVGA